MHFWLQWVQQQDRHELLEHPEHFRLIVISIEGAITASILVLLANDFCQELWHKCPKRDWTNNIPEDEVSPRHIRDSTSLPANDSDRSFTPIQSSPATLTPASV